MKTPFHLLFFLLLACITSKVALAHEVPMSYVTLRTGINEAQISVKVAWSGLRHDLPAPLGPNSTVPATAELLEQNQASIQNLLISGLTLTADGTPVVLRTGDIQLAPEGDFVVAELSGAWQNANNRPAPPPEQVTLASRLFPTATDHKTMVSVYRGETLEKQTVLTAATPELTHTVGGKQSAWEVVWQFIGEGIHHIFIGPDHILFIVGLLLAGGNLPTLLKVVTCFTAAHSITLILATLGILNPSPRLVEPVIALSIVFVGLYTLFKKEEKTDWRMGLAFGFGLIHGFGFAGVLGELELPRYALGWSLLAFNVGVEIGQACIILLVAPLLLFLTKTRPTLGKGIVYAGSLIVLFFGAFWFVERVLAP